MLRSPPQELDRPASLPLAGGGDEERPIFRDRGPFISARPGTDGAAGKRVRNAIERYWAPPHKAQAFTIAVFDGQPGTLLDVEPHGGRARPATIAAMWASASWIFCVAKVAIVSLPIPGALVGGQLVGRLEHQNGAIPISFR